MNKEKKESALKVEFYCNIYFSIYGLHPIISKIAKTEPQRSID